MRKPNRSKLGTKKEIIEIIEVDSDSDLDSSADEVGGRMLALCGEVNASYGKQRMRRPNSSKVGTTSVKREIIALGRMLALRGEVNSLCKPLNTSAAVGGTNKTNMQIVCADDCASDIQYDLDYMKYLVSCRESHHHPYLLEKKNSPMRIMYTVDNEATDRSKGREVKDEKSRGRRRSKSPLISSVSKKLKPENRKEDHNSISTTVFRKDVVLRGRKIAVTKNTIRLEPTSNDGKDTQKEKEVSLRRRKIALPKNTIKLKPTSNDGKYTQQEKEVSLRGKKISLPKNTIKLEPKSDVKDTQQEKQVSRRGRKPKNNFKACKLETEESSAKRKAKPQTIFRASKRLQAEKIIPVVNIKDTQRKKEDARQGKNSSVTKNNFKAYEKENEESSARRNGKSQIFGASKRLKTEKGRADHNSISKTIPVVNIKDTKRKKGEAPQQRKIPVNKNDAKSKSTSHVKDNLRHSFKAHKKENEESRSLIDKSYEYFLAYLRNSVTVVEPDRKVKPEKDSVSLSDPDIIAVSNYPFSDGGYSPFEANKDGKVIDLEDRIEPDNIFNSSFSKKLLEILRQPYDKNEFLQLCHEASYKRQVTRSRQLRDGREIEYNVDDQLGPSYLDQYPDFKRMFRRCRYGKDDTRALNLLRGFFFYLENIVLEGAFKPWLYETRVKRECEDIESIK